ncbi:hypothetical protein BH10BAC2_BH10BAC2_38340 [soil metagenome]
MFKNKTLLWSLVIYLLLQLASLFLSIGILLLTYIVAYLVAIFVSSKYVFISIKNENNFNPLFYCSLLFFISNLLLFLIYIPTLIYNPNINWILKGEAEVDPMILQAYVPPMFFVAAILTLLFSTLAAKLVTAKGI